MHRSKTGHLNRTLKTIGVKRRAKDVTPSGLSRQLHDLYVLEGKIDPTEEDSE